MVSKDDLDKFEEKKMKKIVPIVINWFYKLIKQHVMGDKWQINTDKLEDN